MFPRSPPPPAPPPPHGGSVSVSISGPAEVTEGESNTWTATANGATGGYAYVWYRSDQGAPMTYVGSNPTYAASFGECGTTSTLRVVVEAGSGSTAASEFLIAVACELEL